VSLFEAQAQIASTTVSNFFSEPDLLMQAVRRLQEAGFQVLQASPLTINIAGSAETYRRAFKTVITAEAKVGLTPDGQTTTFTFLDSPDTALPGLISTDGTPFADILEGVALEERRAPLTPSMFPPLKTYWHLDVPAGVSLGINADRAHRTGITGRGIRVAMVDSGWFKHPFFVARGYRAAPVVLGPGAANPLADESGHGTGESANIFAAAPDVELLPVKINFSNSVGAFNAAVALGPDIITCSWGSHRPNGPLTAADQALAAAIASAVASGIIVVFSAGNGHAGFPGQLPDVISAGGVFMDVDESLQASNYASGFMSNIFVNRRVPDLCGLVGLQPKAIYIMLPLESGDQIDVGNAGGTHPNRDETASSDGWAAFSGTSAAAPQLAGVAALMKQACPTLSPMQVRNILMNTARDVTTGSCNAVPGIHNGLPAGPGPDTATGNGLVDAHKAVLSAKVTCLGPITPIIPITGITPITPITTITPVTPITPITVITPVTPIVPITAITPITRIPITPILPPVRPGPEPGPAPVSGERQPERPSTRLSAEDVEALQQLISESGFEPGEA
jgi:hypothetical protein